MALKVQLAAREKEKIREKIKRNVLATVINIRTIAVTDDDDSINKR